MPGQDPKRTSVHCDETAPPGASVHEDVELAAATDVPVLISGPAAASRRIACELDRRSRSGSGTVDILDCRRADALDALSSRLRWPDRAAGRGANILLLEEVHALSPDDQTRLEQQLELRTLGRGPALRIVASSSVPLFDRVVNHSFNQRLYYLLNVIHIVVPMDRRSRSTRPPQQLPL